MEKSLIEKPEEYLSIPVDEIAVNDNIRKTFDEAQLKELAESLKAYGVLEPLLVRTLDGEWGRVYVLVSGERRLRAAKIAGLAEVPCRVIKIDAKQAAEIQLLENLQRTDLNALEEAQALSGLIREHGYTQEALAQKLGKSQPWVAGRVRLLDLPESVQTGITRGIVNASAAEVLARYSQAAPEIVKKVVESMKDKPIPVAKMREEVDYMVANRGKPLDNLQTWEKPAFDVAACISSCPKAVRLRLSGYKDERPYCTNAKCWEAKNKAAQDDVFRQAIEAAGEATVDLSTLPRDKYTIISRDYAPVKDCPVDCEHRKKGINRLYNGQTEMVEACLDYKCFGERRDAYFKEQQDAKNAQRQAKMDEYLQLAKGTHVKHWLGELPHHVLVSLGVPLLLSLGWSDKEIGYAAYGANHIALLRKMDAMQPADFVGLLLNVLIEHRVRDGEFPQLDYLVGRPLPAPGEPEEPDEFEEAGDGVEANETQVAAGVVEQRAQP